ncbi:MAG: transposase [Candidatus Yonathbacteria bacterium]|nr:transposase [Candidatus Yonathbacteria bacterium]
MTIRKTAFVEGEHYHVYNRGVDKRNIFSDEFDVQRFFQSMEEFNVIDPIGSIYQNSFTKNTTKDSQLGSSTPKLKLVNFICYCLNQNHYHFILEQVSDKGIEKFMHRLGTGYTNYFNKNNKRNGALFQGKFKAVHIDSNEQLLHVSAYVNLNDKMHQLGSSTPKLVKSRSSWGEYTADSKDNFCSKDIILEQFKNTKEYRKFAEASLGDIIQRKNSLRNITEYLME